MYFAPTGAYMGGRGWVEVTVSPRLAPFLERNVYFLPESEADADVSRYVTWAGARSLRVVGEPLSPPVDIRF